MQEGEIRHASPHSPKQNHLLDALPAADYARLLPDLGLMPMPLGWAVYESGGNMGYVYFPTTSLVSLLYVMESGASAEIAITGNEGLVGISLFMGGESTPRRAVVQSSGNGYRLKARVLKREFELGGALQRLALRYTQAIFLLMKNKIWDLPLCLIPGNLFNLFVAEKASSVKFILIEGETTFLDDLLQLAGRVILSDGEDTIFWSSGRQFRTTGQYDPIFLTSQKNELVEIFSPVVNGVKTKHP